MIKRHLERVGLPIRCYHTCSVSGGREQESVRQEGATGVTLKIEDTGWVQEPRIAGCFLELEEAEEGMHTWGLLISELSSGDPSGLPAFRL